MNGTKTHDAPKVIAVCGKICSGKTLYAKRLKQREDAVILSTDEATWMLTGNEQGPGYDRFCVKVNAYLRKKAAEIVKAGCTVILDWGFWTRNDRWALTEYFREEGIRVEWHWIEISDADWETNIRERNARIRSGFGGSDFYVDEGLKEKLERLWQDPDPSEIDVRVPFCRPDALSSIRE